jgi:hypothetical protein
MRLSGWVTVAESHGAEYTARRTDGASIDFFGFNFRKEHRLLARGRTRRLGVRFRHHGFNYTNMTIEDDVVAQCEQAFKNIEAALKQADATFADVVRVHYLMTSAADFEPCWPPWARFSAKFVPLPR